MIRDNRPNAVNYDEEIDIFEEDFWSFMQPLQDRAEGYEFFADISDNDEYITRGLPYSVRISLLVASTLVVLGIIFAGYLRYIIPIMNDKERYNTMQAIQDEEAYFRLQRIDGEHASSEDIANISIMLSRYFGTLNSQENYSDLNNYCYEGSLFHKSILGYLDKMQYSYDEYDCYARVLKEFGSFCSLVKINDVLIKDGKYYVYTDLNIPSESDIDAYIHMYSYNMTKHFTANEVTSENIIGYLLDLTNMSAVPCRTKEYCIEVTKLNEGYFMINDSVIYDTCNNSYAHAVERITSMLGGSIISDGLNLN